MARDTWQPGDGLAAAMEVIDGPSELAPSAVPTLDQQVPVSTYQDWRAEDTRVVTCAIANEVYPGQRYGSREEARRAVEVVHGRILEANFTPGRAFFRVFRVRTSA